MRLLYIQADMEEAKTQENRKLQAALQEMELQYKETKELLVKEREVSKNIVEHVPVVQEVPIIDNAMVEKLTAENEKLKVSFPLCEYFLCVTFSD
jgi:myosin V